MRIVISMGLALTLGAFAHAGNKAGDTAEMDPMMKKMQEAGAPGEAHERLKPLEGRWTAKSRMWMKPGDKAEESSGTAVFSLIFAGRYLKQDFSGDWAGNKFQGLGYLGYDNIRKEYVNTWMDSMSTGLAYSTGQYDKALNAIKDEGTFACPMTGEKNKWFRGEWQMPKGDAFLYTMYSKDDSGKEFKSMEIAYKRVK